MAITITQSPTSPNAAYTKLVYVISGSSNTTAPQFEYVMDVYESGSTNLISRVTQTVNPAGVAVFDPSRIIQGQLQYDIIQKTSLPNSTSSLNKDFEFKFGEQYGTSTSSSITVYPNATSSSLSLFPGLADTDATMNSYWENFYGSNLYSPNGFNFQSGSYEMRIDTVDCFMSNNPYLQQLNRRVLPESSNNQPYLPVGNQRNFVYAGSEDYMTVSVLKGIYDGTPSAVASYQINAVDVDNNSLGLVSGSIAITDDLITYGIGPANVELLHPGLLTSDWGAYQFTCTAGPSAGVGSVEDVFVVKEGINQGSISNLSISAYTLYSRPNIGNTNEKVRFAFINKYGVWDYYTNYNPVRRSSDIQRENVTLPRVDYSSITSPYNITRRGEKSYFVEHTDRFTVDTQLLNKETANWVEELLESPSVFIQRGDNFVPVVLTNNTYKHNNDTARNKLFQYTIEFEPANQPFGEWVPEYADVICSFATPVPTSTPTVTPTPSPTPSPTPTPIPGVFDPSLSGALTVNHWWDFTDSTSMTLSGSNEITAIEDKGSAPVLVDLTSSETFPSQLVPERPVFLSSQSGSFFTGSANIETGIASGSFPDTLAGVNYLTYVSIFKPFALDGTEPADVFGLRRSTYWDELSPAIVRNSSTGWQVTNAGLISGSTDYPFIGAHMYDPQAEGSQNRASIYPGANIGPNGDTYMLATKAWMATSPTNQSNFLETSVNGSAFGGQVEIFGVTGSYPGPDQVAVGVAPWRDYDPTPWGYIGTIEHVLVYSGSLDSTQLTNLYNNWTASKV